jgi:hypothetical protein
VCVSLCAATHTHVHWRNESQLKYIYDTPDNMHVFYLALSHSLRKHKNMRKKSYCWDIHSLSMCVHAHAVARLPFAYMKKLFTKNNLFIVTCECIAQCSMHAIATLALVDEFNSSHSFAHFNALQVKEFQMKQCK